MTFFNCLQLFQRFIGSLVEYKKTDFVLKIIASVIPKCFLNIWNTYAFQYFYTNMTKRGNNRFFHIVNRIPCCNNILYSESNESS
jgi:hypothetical protein